MLEHIKMLLTISDISKDDLINYHIEVVTNKILNFTGQDALPTSLQYIVEEIVVDRINGKQRNVKTVNNGTTTIEYSNTNELQPYEKELSRYKTMKVI